MSKDQVSSSKYLTIKVNGQKLLSLQSTIQITLAGNNKTINKNRKFNCGDCRKEYTSKQPFNKHIEKHMKMANQKNKEITSQITEQTNKNDEALSEADELLNEDNEISTDQDDLELLDCIEQLNQNINITNEDPEENQKQFNEKIQRLKTVIEKKNKVRDELHIRIKMLAEKNKNSKKKYKKLMKWKQIRPNLWTLRMMT